jgi:GTP cyclohydrolase I
MAKSSARRHLAEEPVDLRARQRECTDRRTESIAPQVRQILRALGEDVEREGLLRTPTRVDDALKFLTRGYTTCVEDVVAGAVFEERHESMVLVRDIEIY